jgi:cell division septum initiation protein DivIVA
MALSKRKIVQEDNTVIFQKLAEENTELKKEIKKLKEHILYFSGLESSVLAFKEYFGKTRNSMIEYIESEGKKIRSTTSDKKMLEIIYDMTVGSVQD